MMIDIFEELPGEIAWKDRNFCYLGCNKNRARKLALTYPDAIIGMSDHDLNDQTNESIDFHKQHDQLALSGSIIKTLHPSAKDISGKTYYQIKKPIKNNGEITGIIYHCQEFIQADLFHSLKKMDSGKLPSECLFPYYEIQPKENIFSLSVRELECLFCLLRGMTSKMIAEILSLSKRTVEFYIENIKNKFSCNSKTELIILAFENNYIQIIPERLLTLNWKHFILDGKA